MLFKLKRFFFRHLHRFLNFPPGHFYSPLPVAKWREAVIPANKALQPGLDGIALNTAEQLELIARLSASSKDYPFGATAVPPLRYGFENDFFPKTDGAVLHAMMREFKPKRIVEVGSGFSSALILDTNDMFLDGATKLSFIEPYPDRLLSLLSEQQRQSIDLLETGVQNVDLSIFQGLEKNDILFIDSSHVSKVGSDVNHLLFNIIPLLAPGVIVHLHDIPYPFEYPDAWFDQGRAWNEAYFLRSFLQYNDTFQILLWMSQIGVTNREDLERLWPEIQPGSGFSIYLKKM